MAASLLLFKSSLYAKYGFGNILSLGAYIQWLLVLAVVRAPMENWECQESELYGTIFFHKNKVYKNVKVQNRWNLRITQEGSSFIKT